MKALMKKEPKEGIWMEDVPVPEIGPDDVLIKIKRTAICGTDIHIYKWDEWSQKTVPVPMVVGHEYSGVIDQVGANVKHLKKGQRVSGEGHLVCGHCRNCRNERQHLCPNTKGIGVNVQGAFAEYLRLPATNVVPLPDDISDDVGAILDPYGNATHTALAYDLVGEDVLITGAGPIGAMAAGIASKAGARTVTITDVNDYRLGLAEKMAPNIHAVNTSKVKLADIRKKLKIDDGFTVGLEMSGNAHAFKDMIDNMIMGGNIALLGIFPGKIETDWSSIIFKAFNIKCIYGREMYRTWNKMIAMAQSGYNVGKIITHHFSANDFQKGFDAMLSGQSGKVILEWD